MMASSQNPQFCEHGLKLGIHLLQNGNRKVQDAIYALLVDRFAATAQPFDGTSQTLLENLRAQLRLAVLEINEAKFYRQQQR